LSKIANGVDSQCLLIAENSNCVGDYRHDPRDHAGGRHDPFLQRDTVPPHCPSLARQERLHPLDPPIRRGAREFYYPHTHL
jgi:hypothetical protein